MLLDILFLGQMAHQTGPDRTFDTGTCGRHTPDGWHSCALRQHNTLRRHITEEPAIVLKRIFLSSEATLRTLLVAVSLVAMALAGSAGGHWG